MSSFGYPTNMFVIQSWAVVDVANHSPRIHLSIKKFKFNVVQLIKGFKQCLNVN